MICLLCCNIYKKEIEAISDSEDFKDVKTFFFGPACWNPKDTKSRVKTQISKIREELPESFIEVIACNPCFKSRKEAAVFGTNKPESFYNEEFGPNCNFVFFENYSHLFVSKAVIDSYISQNAYLLTQGWLLKWKAHLKEWGFDKKTASEFFRESVEKLILLDSGVSDKSLDMLKDFSLYLGLPYEVVKINLDYFKLNIEKIICNSKNKTVKQELQKKILKANKIAADYAMAMDIISSISNISEESEVIKKILELFVQIFGAKKINYLQFFNDKKGQIFSYPNSCKASLNEVAILEKFNKNYEIIPSNGFLITISFLNDKLGVLEVQNIASIENLNQYLSLSLVISNVCSLAITNARKYRALEESNEKYKFISFHDGFTSLYNRAYFEEEMKRFNMDIERFRPIAVISADINWLKETNDKMGHEFGDILINDASKILSSSVRKSDILARIGGDEFCIILPGSDKTAALRVINQIRKHQTDFNNDPVNLKNSIKVSMALGYDISEIASSKNIYETLKNSDKEMYKNKAEIKNAVKDIKKAL